MFTIRIIILIVVDRNARSVDNRPCSTRTAGKPPTGKANTVGMQVMQDDGLGRGSIVTPNKRLPPDVGANANVRSTVFAHLTGIVLAPTVSALWDLKILEQLGLTRDGADLDAIVRQSGANRAYLRVALRVLESAGWMARKAGTDFFSFTERGKFAMRELVSLYRVAASFAPLALSI